MRRILAAVLCFAVTFPSLAQEWPTKPIRFVVPWPAGGLNDLIARAFNDRVAKALGQTVINDFKAGAGGRIGVADVARAAPDGYTIGMGNLGPLTIFPNLYKNMPYDAKKDLIPITMFAASPLVLVVPANLPTKNVRELIALAKAQPGKLNYASVGIGTAQHLIFEMFKKKDGADMVHVPFKGTNESLPQMITTPQRVPQLPDVPTLIESGYPEVDVVTWYALIAPAGTPKAIIDRLYKEYTIVSQMPEVQKFLAEQGLVYIPNTQVQFSNRIDVETARWGQIVREQGIKVEQ